MNETQQKAIDKLRELKKARENTTIEKSSSTYKKIDENIKEITDIINLMYADDKKLNKGLKEPKTTVEPLSRKEIKTLFESYILDDDGNNPLDKIKSTSSIVAKINNSLTHHKIRVINKDKELKKADGKIFSTGVFRIEFLD